MTPSMAAPPFILFMDRLLGTAHLMTLAPPRVDGGKHIDFPSTRGPSPRRAK